MLPGGLDKTRAVLRTAARVAGIASRSPTATRSTNCVGDELGGRQQDYFPLTDTGGDKVYVPSRQPDGASRRCPTTCKTSKGCHEVPPPTSGV